jgi:class 3 adenylate cyclase/tetratricopeptide (TPR) repeat protein
VSWTDLRAIDPNRRDIARGHVASARDRRWAMRCAACGGDNPEGKRFCKHCGGAFGSLCGGCGAPLEPDDQFCGDCGAPISVQGVPPPNDGFSAEFAHRAPGVAPVSERRLCSVLFVDLVGFTPLAERRDPEEIRELLSLYFDRAQAIVGHYGGTVEKFIGDAVMAVWGAPVANEDDAERAVRAALEIVASVAALGTESGIDLAARAGVVTGEVAITIGKVSEGMVLGDTVNSASRVQSVAPPGAVLVDESTWRAASGAVAFSEVGDLQLKGKQDLIHAWRAVRVVAQRKGVGRSERLEPPFVGRDEELRLIKDLFHSTAREQRARLVSVTGIPGIGKSRLGWEFLKYVDGLAETVYWHEGRSPAYGEGITFWALGEMVRMRAGITESEDAVSSRSKLSATVVEFVTDPEERRWVEPRLAHLLGLAEAPPGDRQELFSAWRTFFERIAAFAPTVMVFEDLQWADPGLVDFIESILEWSRNHALMIVTLARPELMDRRPSWGAGQRNFISLHLESLSEEAMRQLLSGFVHGLPQDVAASILERSDGVPLYAVETVRMLVGRGLLAQRDGVYDVAGELGSLAIPETLQALTASRLDALPGEQRSLLQDAAVLGNTFSAEVLIVLHGGERSTLEAHLRDLVRKEFLSLDADPRSPERGQYGFVQGLIAEVASSTLSRRDRSAKHLVVARHLESLEDDELTGLVAAHFVEAYRSAPDGPEAELIAVGARDWLSRAGQRALSLGSPEQALSFFDQALEVTPEGAERAVLAELAGDAAGRASAYERALSLLEEAVSYYEAAGDMSALGSASAKLIPVLGVGLKHLSDAIERGEHYFRVVGDAADRVRAELASELAAVHMATGSPQRSLEWAETALVLAEQLDDNGLLAGAIGAKAGALYNLGRHREAVILARGQVQLAAAAGGLREQANGLLYLSVFQVEEDPRKALSAGLESAELARRAGQRGLEVMNLLNAAEMSVLLGEWNDTRAAIVELRPRELQPEQVAFLECVEAMLLAFTGAATGASALLEPHASQMAVAESIVARATYLRARSVVSLAAGEIETAHREAAQAISTDPLGINSPHALAIRARAALWLRDADRAREAQAAMASFRGRWMAAARLTTEAGLAALDGRTTEATAAYRAAIEAWRALDCTLDLALCELDLALLLGPDTPAGSAAKEARDIFTELGARPFLDRLNDAVGAEQ